MKKHITLALAASSLVLLSACKNETETAVAEPIALDSLEKKVSYFFGYNLAKQMPEEFVVDADVMAQAIRGVQSGAEPAISEEDMEAAFNEFRALAQAKAAEEREKAQAEQAKLQEENLAKGAAFLEENGKKDDVITTESGLQYKVIREGGGATPVATDKVRVNYAGRLLDGTEFDSSYKRNEPAEFGVSNLIPAWVEALQLMKEGGKFEIYVPASLGYGSGGTGKIPPNSVLIFDMELLEIVKEAAPAE